MLSKKSFKLVAVSSTTPFFAVVQIISFHDCSNQMSGKYSTKLQNCLRTHEI